MSFFINENGGGTTSTSASNRSNPNTNSTSAAQLGASNFSGTGNNQVTSFPILDRNVQASANSFHNSAKIDKLISELESIDILMGKSCQYSPPEKQIEMTVLRDSISEVTMKFGNRELITAEDVKKCIAKTEWYDGTINSRLKGALNALLTEVSSSRPSLLSSTVSSSPSSTSRADTRIGDLISELENIEGAIGRSGKNSPPEEQIEMAMLMSCISAVTVKFGNNEPITAEDVQKCIADTRWYDGMINSQLKEALNALLTEVSSPRPSLLSSTVSPSSSSTSRAAIQSGPTPNQIAKLRQLVPEIQSHKSM
ncbi:MAG: hypothetical protein LBB15_01325, partial [Puniceicoccales bacterium]|nr:hypothetical protein [Puniceicoccales bacterium]